MGNRPTTLPGGIGSTSRPGLGDLGNRPGLGNRPTTLPGGIGSGSRPGIGSGGLPTTLPGNIGSRPGLGGGDRPGLGNIGSRPGLGGSDRPTTLPGNIGSRPGLGGGDRPTTLPGNIGSRPGLGGGDRPGLGNIGSRPGLGGSDRPTTLPGNIGSRPGLGGSDRPTTLPGMIGDRPSLGGGDRPGLGNIGNRPGLGGGDRPTTLPGNIGNRPGLGGGDRPTTLPGIVDRPGIGGGNRPGLGGGDRPTTLPGIVDRPGIGGGIAGNRPGRPGGDGGWFGGINRPGFGDGNIGSGNLGIGGGNQIGDSLSYNNWSNQNNYNSYYHNNNTNTNINTNIVGGGWGGGGWGNNWGGGGWGNNWGGGGWGNSWGGWNTPFFGGFYNDWYSGWGPNYLNNWLAPAVGFGVGLGVGNNFGLYSGVGSVFPSWGTYDLMGWGLGSVADTYLASTYSNPYYAAPVNAAAPIYDYSQPINVTAAAPEPTVTDQGQALFTAARDAFKAGDYVRALDQTNQALEKLPNDPVLHEFRALALFALRQYDEASAVIYAVLTAGPGWTWSTMAGLYPDVEVYTNQLRALEAQVKSNPDSASDQFLLAYHYLTQGHQDAARTRFEKVLELVPNDQLSAQFARALTPPEQPQPADGQAPPAAPSTTPITDTSLAASDAPPEPPPLEPPPASLVGTWKSTPNPDMAIALTLGQDGSFQWQVTPSSGEPQTIQGKADYRNEVLSLLQEQGPPLAGKVVLKGDNQFNFQLAGGENAPALTFTK